MSEPLLLVPGLMCTRELFQPQLDALVGGREVTVVDHACADNMRDIAFRILDSSPDRFALAGLSMGVYVSLQIVALAPQRVTRLALLDGKARLDTAEQTAARLALVAMANSGDYLSITKDVLLDRLIAPLNATMPGLKETIIRMAVDTGEAGFRRQMAAIMERPDYLPGLSRIACPTLIMTGELDAITPPECAVEMAGLISHSVLHLVPDCGHLCTLETPTVVNSALQTWLGET